MALFVVAVLVVAARIATRIRLRHRIYLDDYFLLFGLACLCGATGLVLNFARIFFIMEALDVDHSFVLTIEDLTVTNVPTLMDSFLFLSWTTVVSVKFSFLALFRLLIRRVSKKLTAYYWFVVVFTALTWAFLVNEAFIACSVFGLNACKRTSIHAGVSLPLF